MSNNEGKVAYVDCRQDEPLWTITAHEKEVTGKISILYFITIMYIVFIIVDHSFSYPAVSLHVFLVLSSVIALLNTVSIIFVLFPGLILSNKVPGLMITTSTDGKLKTWDTTR